MRCRAAGGQTTDFARKPRFTTGPVDRSTWQRGAAGDSSGKGATGSTARRCGGNALARAIVRRGCMMRERHPVCRDRSESAGDHAVHRNTSHAENEDETPSTVINSSPKKAFWLRAVEILPVPVLPTDGSRPRTCQPGGSLGREDLPLFLTGEVLFHQLASPRGSEANQHGGADGKQAPWLQERARHAGVAEEHQRGAMGSTPLWRSVMTAVAARYDSQRWAAAPQLFFCLCPMWVFKSIRPVAPDRPALHRAVAAWRFAHRPNRPAPRAVRR